MQALETNGQILYVEDRGAKEAQALVFSNSLGTDFRVWDPLIPHLPKNLRLIRYDKRGHGLSSGPDAPYSMEDHKEDLSGLLDQLGVTQAVIVGLSVGGMIAQSLAASRPDLVSGLVLSSTAHVIGPPDMWETRIEAIEKGGIASLSEVILERWFSAEFHRERTQELAIWRAMLTRTPVSGYIGTCRAIQAADLTESTKNLDLPAICVGGNEDGSTPPSLMRSLAGLLGSDFVEIDGVGHLPPVECPKKLGDIITAFLREHRFL